MSRTGQFPDRWIACALFVVLFMVYIADGGFLVVADTMPGLLLPFQIMEHGAISFEAQEIPFGLSWKLGDAQHHTPVELLAVDDETAALEREGLLRPGEPSYAYSQSVRYPNRFVSTFGPGTGITVLPAFLVSRAVFGASPDDWPSLYYTGKASASLIVALTVAVTYLTAAQLVPRRAALLTAVCLGLGTALWSSCTQFLMQQGPCALFVAVAAHGFLRRGEGSHWMFVCGFAMGMATVCRPTWAVATAALGIYLVIYDRRSLAAYVLGGLPTALAFLAYNMHYFEHPLAFGQLDKKAEISRVSPSQVAYFSTPLLVGAAGILLSPSRGLLVFSPFLAFAAWGALRAYRDERFRPLFPLLLSILAIWPLEFKFFDWWGGFSYGSRHLSDSLPILILFVLPVMEDILRVRALGAIYALLLAWSVALQVLGVAAYDSQGWNNRRGIVARDAQGDIVATFVEPLDSAMAQRLQAAGRRLEEVEMDIDLPEFRHRLWSFKDSQIVFLITNFAECRNRKKVNQFYSMCDRRTRRVATHQALAEGWRRLGREDRASQETRIIEKLGREDPTYSSLRGG